MTKDQKPRVVEVSMSNIKAWVETGLRQLKEIKDDEFNVTINFNIDWEKKDTVPIQIKAKKEADIIPF